MTELSMNVSSILPNHLVLSDGAFDEARGNDIARVMTDDALVYKAAEELEIPRSFLPTLAVIGLVTDGDCKNEKYRDTYKTTDPTTYVANTELYEEAPLTIWQLGKRAKDLGCNTVTFLSIGSLLVPDDHYLGLMRGLVATRSAKDLYAKERKTVRRLEGPAEIDGPPLLDPHGSTVRAAKEKIEALEKQEHDQQVAREKQAAQEEPVPKEEQIPDEPINPSPFILTFGRR